MLKLALAFEVRTLLRSRTSLLALFAFLAVGVLAILAGQRFVAQWQDALLSAEEAERSLFEEARAHLDRGEPGPEDRPWVDLSRPLWQDWYAATRVARSPGALAGVAAGAVDPAPAVFRVSRLADPLAAGGYRIENPEQAAGAVDLVFVLGLLLPLLIGVLGLNVGSRERESHLQQLITVQAGSSRSWLIARIAVVTLLAATAAAALCLVAGILGGASGFETGLLLVIALIYAALWGGLLLVINARARTVREAAFSFGALWTLLCVLLPTLASEFALGHVQADYALLQTLDARGQRYDAYDRELPEILPMLYARYPELRSLPAAAEDPLDPSVARHAYDGVAFAALEERNRSRIQQEQEAARITRRAIWISPTVALALALERLAGVGPDAAAAYRDYLVAAVLERGRWVLEQAWSQRTLGADDFESLVAEAPLDFQASPQGLFSPMLALSAWTLGAWLLALARVTRRPAQARQLHLPVRTEGVAG